MLMVAPLPKQFMGHTSRLKSSHGIQLSPQLRILLVTTHVAIKDLPEILTAARVLTAIRLASQAGQQYFGIRSPKIAVAGLNPHAGEGGILGLEEQQIILPAISRARQMGLKVSGPFPADTLMLRVIQGDYDLVVAMYHDQALIPIKLFSFGKAVNVTVGLPFIRTSVDHGTASDIAWRGKADPSSLITAIQLAVQLSKKRKMGRTLNVKC
jgi:4-hydroxythreonine-4-phosphate dehydrogenase